MFDVRLSVSPSEMRASQMEEGVERSNIVLNSLLIGVCVCICACVCGRGGVGNRRRL